MNTTNVFIELLVIGLGPLAIIGILFAGIEPEAIQQMGPLTKQAPILVAVPLLAATYVLGIAADRVADAVFGMGFSTRLRRRYFETDEEYHRARRTILIYAPAVYRLREYGRSRMRIARGWSVNIPLIALPLNLLVGRIASVSTILLVDLLLAVAWCGMYYSWRTISVSEYEKIRSAASFIRNEMASGSFPATQ